MTREEAIARIIDHKIVHKMNEPRAVYISEALEMAIKALKQEPFRDIEEIAEIMSCVADAETKCKMISNILTAKPHYFAEQKPKVTTTSTDEPMVMQYPQVDGITPTVVKKKPTLDDLWANIKKWKEEAEQEPNENAYDKVLAYLKANVDDFPDYHEAIEAVLEMKGGAK